jgi:hypothetical protein
MIHDKLLPWRMAKAREQMVKTMTVPIRFTTAFMQAWVKVMYPEPNKR